MVTIFLLSGAGTAFADCHGDGDDAGSGSTSVGSGYQSMAWNLGNKETYVSSRTLPEMSNQVCLEARSDWMTSGLFAGHYDARAARNCDDDSNRGGSILETSWGANVTGLQKAAGCKYRQDAEEPYYSNCDYVPESQSGCTFGANSARAWTAMSHAVLMRKQNGEIKWNDGGIATDPDN